MPSIKESAEIVVKHLDVYTDEILKGSEDARFSLVDLLVPNGQDRLPKIPIRPGLFRHLKGRQRLALSLAHDTIARYNRNFDVTSSAYETFNLGHPTVVKLFGSVSAVVQGLLHPDRPLGDPQTLIDNQIRMVDSYYNLIDQASNRY